MRIILAAAVGAALLSAPAAAAEPIRIGMAAPLSGSSAAIGHQMLNGTRQAVADINAAGGVLGRPLELLTEDDVCDPGQAVAVANRLVGEEVVAVIGHYCSGASIPASDVYADAEIVQISPGSTNPAFTERGLDNVFRVCGRDDQQAAVAAAYVAERFKGEKVAVSHDMSPPGVTLATIFRENLERAGVPVVFDESINLGELDFSALVTKLKHAGATVLYHSAYHKEAGLIVRQAAEQSLKLRLVSNDDLNVPDFWAITGAAGDGALFTFQADVSRNPQAKPVVERLHAAGSDATGYTLYAYAAVQAWASAVTATGATDFAAVMPALRKGPHDTVIGKVSFDTKGDVTNPAYRVYEWRDGRYDYAP
ncbi:branched-chain amino acid ABC transporter substrate-binding protein [Azospirillum sp. ST 5-10]|uniref:branched-chain amino acid ABC transporter substrate-binding protein n=1 Tax=unclassified Azospirillum TaxID=2630922 RepID=UPI003F49FB81